MKRSVRYLCQAALTVTWALSASIPALGQGGVPGFPDTISAYDPREVALLPRYCIYTQSFSEHVPGGNNQAKIQQWYSIMGPGFHAMHHYCWGLMKTNRAILFTRTREYRMHYLSDAIGEFDYVIRNVTPDFVMLPEIFTKKGENLIRLGRGPQGLMELRRAIGIKPDYWPPYASISDYYKKTGDLAKAREWLEKGLSATPDVKALKRRMAEIDRSKDKRTRAPQSGNPQQPLKP